MDRKYHKLRQGQGFAEIAIVIVVLVIAGLAGAYYLGRGTSQPQPSPSSQVSPPPKQDETANWDVYTNQQLGFSVKIPPQFSVFLTTEGPEAGQRVDFAQSKPYIQSKYWVWLSTTPNVNQFTADDAVDNYLSAKSTYKDGKYVSINEMPELAKSIKKQSLTIAGRKAVSLYPVPSQTDTKFVYVTTDKWVYSFALQAGTLLTLDEEAMNTFDQILSNVRFLE